MGSDPITTVDQLVAQFERSTFDYKTTYDLRKPGVRYHIAKDVAAFATAFGGTIVVGVVETGGKAIEVSGVADVPGLLAEVARALQTHCVPVPPTPEEHAIIVTPADAVKLLAPGAASGGDF